jgi:hypothetical protein
MSHRSKRGKNPRLKQLLAELAKDFGKTTRWRVLCKEQHAAIDADQIRPNKCLPSRLWGRWRLVTRSGPDCTEPKTGRPRHTGPLAFERAQWACGKHQAHGRRAP